MRVFALDYEPSSRRGGQELSLVDECVALAERGLEMTLGYVKAGDLLARYERGGVRTRALSEIEIRPHRRVRSAAGMAAAILRSAATRPDIVCVNQYHDTLFGAGVALAARAPLVCHLRLMPPAETCTQWRLGLARVDRFMAASGAIADAWVARGGLAREMIDAAIDGVDTDFFRPRDTRAAVRHELGIPADAFVALSAGRLDESKNLEGLLRAFALLDVAGAQLLVAGRPVSHATPQSGEAYVESLRALARSLGIADRVHWLGSRADVPDLLAAADVSLLFAYEEALGRVTMEALACGRPVLASRGGGTDELLVGEFAALRIDPLDAPGSAAALRSLVGWQARDPGFSTRARAFAVDAFSVGAKARAVEQCFTRALENGRPGAA